MTYYIKPLVAASIAVVISSDVVTAWSGSVTFFQDAGFRGPNHIEYFTGDNTYTCYTLNCFNDLASSATWSGIPKSNAIGGPIHIQFYTNGWCEGTMKRWKSTDPFPTNFQIDGINDQISSFMITEIGNVVKRYEDCKQIGRLGTTTANETEVIVQNTTAPFASN